MIYLPYDTYSYYIKRKNTEILFYLVFPLSIGRDLKTCYFIQNPSHEPHLNFSTLKHTLMDNSLILISLVQIRQFFFERHKSCTLGIQNLYIAHPRNEPHIFGCSFFEDIQNIKKIVFTISKTDTLKKVVISITEKEEKKLM